MDEINSFFNFNKPPKRTVVSAGTTCGRIKPSNEKKGIQPRTKLENNSNYAFEYELEHQCQLMKVIYDKSN